MAEDRVLSKKEWEEEYTRQYIYRLRELTEEKGYDLSPSHFRLRHRSFGVLSKEDDQKVLKELKAQMKAEGWRDPMSLQELAHMSDDG